MCAALWALTRPRHAHSGLVDTKLRQAGLAAAGPLFRRCVDELTRGGHWVAIASYGDIGVTATDKVGGIDTIRHALRVFCSGADDDSGSTGASLESTLLAIEAFMPSQQWLREWRAAHAGREPGAAEADSAARFEAAAGKNTHIARLLERLRAQCGAELRPHQVMLVDDDANNVRLAREAGYGALDGFGFLASLPAMEWPLPPATAADRS
jgi:hypothetical protein